MATDETLIAVEHTFEVTKRASVTVYAPLGMTMDEVRQLFNAENMLMDALVGVTVDHESRPLLMEEADESYRSTDYAVADDRKGLVHGEEVEWMMP